jgi:hypothetical protein
MQESKIERMKIKRLYVGQTPVIPTILQTEIED